MCHGVLTWILTPCLVVVLLGSVPCPGMARTVSKQERDQARALLAEGQQRMRQQRYSDAVRLFKEAYRLWQRREIQFNLALAYLEMKDRVAAGRHLRRYLARATADEREALPQRFQLLQQQIGLVRVNTTDRRVEIWIDGRLHGAGQVEVVVLPGKHAVELRLGQSVVKRREFDVGPGREVVWDPPPIPQPRRHRPAPMPAPMPAPLPTLDDRGSLLPERLHWAFFAAAAAVAMGTGSVATYTGVRTLQIRNDLKDHYTEEGVRDLDRHRLATNVLLVVTGAAALTATLLAVFTRWRARPKRAQSVTVIPTLGPGDAGLGIQLIH